MRCRSSVLAFSVSSALLFACAGANDTEGTSQNVGGGQVGAMPVAPTDPAAGMGTAGATPVQTGAPVQAPVGGVTTPDSIDEEVFVDEPIDQAAAEEEAICQSSSEGTQLQDVVLAFAFDVSGSMGLNEEDYQLKWEPIVAATKAFFTDADSDGILATLTFFPSEDAAGAGAGGGNAQNDDNMACEATSYVTPDVAMTALPSPDFGAAIDGVEPERYGTPTMAVLQGTIDSVRAMQTENSNANYAIVMVTDGVPQLCTDEQNDIDNVAAVAGQVAADVPVYVIGVDSPNAINGADATAGLGNLNLIAQQGGTGSAFIIDTGNADQTIADFKAVVDQIRETAFTCNVQIPSPPEGEEFDAELVNVSYQNNIGVTEFTYDEACTADFGWRYDDAANPTFIEMCPAVCEQIKADRNEGQLNVEFGCKQRVAGVR